MTIEQAIELLQTGSKFPEGSHTAEEVDEACQMAIAALNAQKHLEPYAEADKKGRLHILPPDNNVSQCLDLAKQIADMGLTIQQALDILRAQQKQPNEPLTLKELREMEGEPVWCKKEMAYVFVSTLIDKPYKEIYYFTNRGMCKTALLHHTEFYRRKPEREE